ncbi:GlxA family transcriptional regulator [Hydrogenophaga sp. OTU3427]|uniref:GlxA family transcriptional regulator n=1 Tax=Hydrogenophaga sp. OTU3427 TaxID=3043856 RepID=UPI00313BA049
MVMFDLCLPEDGLPGALWSAVDVLRELNALDRVRRPRHAEAVVGWRLLDGAGRLSRQHAATCASDAERRFARLRRASVRVLLLPPLRMVSIHQLNRVAQREAVLVERLRQGHAEGVLVGACGTGQWLLAQAGLLSRAPLPWLYRSGFAERFPGVGVETEEAMAASHRVVAVATPSLLHALVLRLAAMAGLADLAQAAAEKMLLNPERQALSAAMTAQEVMGQSRDVPLFRAQSWIAANASRPFVLAQAAQAAAVSERTLTRLFRQHLGVTPGQHIQDLRVQRARMWLEGTWRSVDEIAHDCGYGDTSAFCRMFARATGLSPQRYREQHTFRGPRARWRLGDAGG